MLPPCQPFAGYFLLLHPERLGRLHSYRNDRCEIPHRERIEVVLFRTTRWRHFSSARLRIVTVGCGVRCVYLHRSRMGRYVGH